MEAISFIIDFFTDINVYIAGAVVYLFPKFWKGLATKLWNKTK